MCKPKSDWELCVDFHGHECLGLATGFRQAMYALEQLGVTKAEDEELLAIVENDACGVDAVQVLTGCTLGKGNLIFRDSGKMAMTLANRRTGKAIRVLRNEYKIPEDEHFYDVLQNIASGLSSEEEQAEWSKIQKERVLKYLALPQEKLYRASEVEMPVIEKARLFKTIICSKCQEPFSEGKARLSEGKILCSDCFQDYSRGW